MTSPPPYSPAAPALPTLLQLLEQGDAVTLEQHARAALAHEPDDPLLASLLAAALQQQGRIAEAATLHRRLSEQQPHEPAHWNNLGTALRELRQPEAADAAYRQACRLDPADPMPHHNRGLLALERSDYAAAREHLLDAHERDPAAALPRLHAAMACHECGDFQREQALVAPWRQWPPLDDEATLELAWLVAQHGDTDAACQLLRGLAARMPQPARAWARLALVLERVNRLEEARGALAQLPAVDALHDPAAREDALNAQAVLAMRDGDWAGAHALFARLLDAPADPRKLSNLYFAFARVCDRLGRVDEAMQACADAHAAQLAGVASLVPELLAAAAPPLPAACHRLSPAAHAAAAPVVGPPLQHSPIFVVGFPRSGTTLLEQMLDAHPDLCAMDEQPFLQQLAERIERHGGGWPDGVAALDQAGCDALRAEYWQRVATVATLAPGQRLVDKNPLNLLRLPLIRRLFPQAPIILALRHPCDVLLSCYMQSFRSPAFAALCASLQRLADGYAATMAHWQAHVDLLGGEVLELRYEDLVDDPAAQVQRLGAFLALDAPERLLGYQAHARAKGYISTPSYAQVVEGINRRGLGRWEAYRRHFAPVLPTLAPWLARWRYPV